MARKRKHKGRRKISAKMRAFNTCIKKKVKGKKHTGRKAWNKIFGNAVKECKHHFKK